MKTIIGWALVAGFLMAGALLVATRWIIAHPPGCDAACKAQRARQWDRMAN